MPQLHLGSGKSQPNAKAGLITVGTQSTIEKRKPQAHYYQKLLSQRGKRSVQRPGRDAKDQPTQHHASGQACPEAQPSDMPGKMPSEPLIDGQDVTVLSSYAVPAEADTRGPSQD